MNAPCLQTLERQHAYMNTFDVAACICAQTQPEGTGQTTLSTNEMMTCVHVNWTCTLCSNLKMSSYVDRYISGHVNSFISNGHQKLAEWLRTSCKNTGLSTEPRSVLLTLCKSQNSYPVMHPAAFPAATAFDWWHVGLLHAL